MIYLYTSSLDDDPEVTAHLTREAAIEAAERWFSAGYAENAQQVDPEDLEHLRSDLAATSRYHCGKFHEEIRLMTAAERGAQILCELLTEAKRVGGADDRVFLATVVSEATAKAAYEFVDQNGFGEQLARAMFGDQSAPSAARVVPFKR